MTEQQTRPLAEIIAKAPPVRFVVVRMNPSENGERDTMRFRWEITKGNGKTITGNWSCGSAVPLLAYQKGEGKPVRMTFSTIGRADRDLSLGAKLVIDAEEKRRAVRAAYLPTLATVVSALLWDYDTAESVGDAWELCREFGTEGVDQIRETVENFPAMLSNGRFIVQWLGELAQEAREAARDE